MTDKSASPKGTVSRHRLVAGVVHRWIVCALTVIGLAYSIPSMALEGQGTIEEVRVCSTGRSDGRINYMFFRLSDGGWFGVYGNYQNNDNSGIVQADSASQSMILLAYANGDYVAARATYGTEQACGVTAAMMYRNSAGDYISITEP